MRDMEEATAMKKANSVLYLALGMAVRKTISDKFPTLNIARITLVDLIKTCDCFNMLTTIVSSFCQTTIVLYDNDCFEKPKNETLDRFTIMSRKQKERDIETVQKWTQWPCVKM